MFLPRNKRMPITGSPTGSASQASSLARENVMTYCKPGSGSADHSTGVSCFTH